MLNSYKLLISESPQSENKRQSNLSSKREDKNGEGYLRNVRNTLHIVDITYFSICTVHIYYKYNSNLSFKCKVEAATLLLLSLKVCIFALYRVITCNNMTNVKLQKFQLQCFVIHFCNILFLNTFGLISSGALFKCLPVLLIRRSHLK